MSPRIVHILDEQSGAGPPSPVSRLLHGMSDALGKAGAYSQVRCPDDFEAADCEVAHIHDLGGGLGSRMARFCASRGIAHIVTLHAESVRQPSALAKLLPAPWRSKPYPASTRLHVIDRHRADELRLLGISNPIDVWPLGVTTRDTSQPAAAVAGLPADRKLILYAGPIESEPQLRPFLKACDAVEDKLQGWHLVLAGPTSADWRDAFAAATRRHGREGVATIVPDASPELFHAAHLVISPISPGHTPFGALEGVACGRPIIATEGTGLDGLSDADGGKIIPPSRLHYERALTEMLTCDREELQSKGQRAHLWAERHLSWCKLAPRYLEVYVGLVRKKSRGPT